MYWSKWILIYVFAFKRNSFDFLDFLKISLFEGLLFYWMFHLLLASYLRAVWLFTSIDLSFLVDLQLMVAEPTVCRSARVHHATYNFR